MLLFNDFLQNIQISIQKPITLDMGIRKNKQKKSNNSNSNKTHEQIVTEQDQQILMAQCQLIYQHLQSNLKQLRQQSSCHLLSKKWLENWKTYVGYELIGKESDGKIPKSVGKRHPGKINEGLVKNNKDYLQIPPSLPQYQYLNTVLSDKLDKDNDYIAVTNKLWQIFIESYEVANDIIRPIRQLKNSFYYDSQLLTFDVIILDYEIIDEHLSKYNKITKKDQLTLFDDYKVQIPAIWQLQDVYVFFEKLVSHLYNQKKQTQIKIWRAFNYLSLQQCQQQLGNNIENKNYLFQGRPIEGQKYDDLDIDQIIKNQYTIIIQCSDQRLKPGPLPQHIKGYCEQCLKTKQLIEYCICQQYHYCSTQCRITDQLFHYKCCKNAFDSEDDEQYENHKIKKNEQFKGCGLDNLGNTCYMNSTLQCIVGIQQIRQFYGNNIFKKEIEEQNDKTKLNLKMSKFIKLLDNQKEKSISPWAIKGQVNFYLSPFRGFKQHDANDFFTNFINTLNQLLHHPDHLYHKLYKQTLMGMYDSTIKCPQCQVQIKSTEIFMQISVPIKQKMKKVFYNYAIVKQNQIIKGKAQLFQTWTQIKKSLKISEQCLIYGVKEGQYLTDIDQSKDSEKVIKSLKTKQLIAYPQIILNEGQIAFQILTQSIKMVCNTQMKSQYGYPHLIAFDPRLTTIARFWIKIGQYFRENEFVQKIKQAQKQYFELKMNNEKNEAQETAESEKAEKEKQNVEQENDIEDVINKKLQQILQFSKIKLYLIDLKKTNNKCSFCNKKCHGCPMEICIDQTIEEFFGDKIDQVSFNIQLPTRFQYPSMQINLGNNGEPNIQDCLQLFREPQQLDEQNAWYCQKCDMMRLAIKQLQIKEFPKVLVIQLNRFKTLNQKKIKNCEPIQYKQIQNFGGNDYRLIGVIIHEGSIDAGHYWAISYRSNRYYIFNDDRVHETDKLVNKNAYILFYKQI